MKQNHSDFTQVLEHDEDSPETKKVSLYGWDAVNLRKTRISVNDDGTFAEFLPTTGQNPSLTLEYTSGNLTKLTKTINSVSYERNFSYDGLDNLTNISGYEKV